MRALGLTLIGIVFAGILALSLMNRTTSLPDRNATPASAAAATTNAPEPAPAVSTEHREPKREALEVESQAEPTAPEHEVAGESIPGPADGVLVEGTVVVNGEDGVERDDCSGSFGTTFWTGNSGTGGGAVTYAAGRFRMRVPKGVELGIDRMKVGDEFADPKPERLPIAEGRVLTVHARVARKVLLHVVDATTKEELRDVTVLWNDDFRTERTIHPGSLGADHVLVAHADSPVVATARADSSYVRWQPTIYAHASGHAWASTKVDYRNGGEETLALPRGGDLEVTIVGEVPQLAARSGRMRSFDADELGAVIRLREPSTKRDIAGLVEVTASMLAKLSDAELKQAYPDLDHRPTKDELRQQIEAAAVEESKRPGSMLAQALPARKSPTRFEGLAPGLLAVSLERGNHWDKPQVIAQSSVDIVEGGVVRATLTIVPDAPKRKVRLAGTVHYSDDWASKYLDLHFEPVAVEGGTDVDNFDIEFQALHPVNGTAGLYRFDAEDVLPGRYLVNSYTLEFQQVVDTGPDGTDQAAIVIGDPADVAVRLLDADSGQPVDPVPELHWNCRRPPESHGGGLKPGEWDPEARVVRLRAPAGSIDLSIGFGHRAEMAVLDPTTVIVKPGANEVTLRLRRMCAVRLHPTIDGRDANWPEADLELWMTSIAPLDAPDHESSPTSESGSELTFSVERPGRYVVHVPTFKGFEAVAPFEIDVSAERSNDVVVPLRRKK
jgi:hypothetical protein